MVYGVMSSSQLSCSTVIDSICQNVLTHGSSSVGLYKIRELCSLNFYIGLCNEARVIRNGCGLMCVSLWIDLQSH